MNVSPDAVVLWERGFVTINATVAFSWGVMAILILCSWLVSRRLTSGRDPGKLQQGIEIIVGYIRGQIEEIMGQDPDRFLPFIGTMFIYISLSNLLAIVPGYQPPTGSIATTGALASCVFVAVPVFGILKRGVISYLKHYVRPTPLMLPFNLIGELSRTLALAVRLFGNVMSGTMIVGILLSVAPFFVPALMQALSLLIGQIQAYIFAVLTAVYIASGTKVSPAAGEAESG